MEVWLADEQATARAAQILASACGLVETITLSGDLGAGKTTFCQHFIRHLLPGTEDVTSPTFTLVHTYERDVRKIAHIDCYRLKSAGELEEIGLAELLETHLCLMEWPEVAADWLPPDRIELRFTRDGEGDARTLTVLPLGNWKTRMPSFEEPTPL